MAGGIFNKLLNMVGLEDVEEEQEEMREEADYYEPEEEEFKDQRFSKKRGKIVGLPSAVRMRMIVYQPKSNEDTQNIIDNLKARKPVVINLDEMENDIAQRVLDFVSGAVYALNGNIRRVARGIFVVAPSNIDIASNVDGRKEEDFYRQSRAARR